MKIYSISFFKNLALSLFLVCLAAMSAKAQTLITDFSVPTSTVSVLGGTTVNDVDANVSGSVLFSFVDLTVTYEVKDPNTQAVVYSETLPVQRITQSPFPGSSTQVGVGQISLPFNMPNDPNISDGLYNVCIIADYFSSANGNNTIESRMNGTFVEATNTGTQDPLHDIGCFTIDYTYDAPCDPTLSATITSTDNKFNRTFVNAIASGGSGNYSYSWSFTTITSNSYSINGNTLTIRCGCLAGEVTITDNTTHCTVTVPFNECARVACSIRPIGVRFRMASVSDKNLFSVSPNPADDILRLKVSDDIAEPVVQLMDMTGRMIEHKTLGNNEASMNVSSFAPGVYLVRLMDGSSLVQQQKVVIR